MNEGAGSSVAKLLAPPQPLSLRDRSLAPAASSAAAAAASSQVAREDLSQLEIESGEGEVVRGEGGVALRLLGKG